VTRISFLTSPDRCTPKAAEDCTTAISTLHEGSAVTCCSNSHRTRLRSRTNIFPSEVKVVYAPVSDETKGVEISPLTSAQSASPRLRKAIIENSDRDPVVGIAELGLNILKGNCKIARCGCDRMRKHKDVLRRLFKQGCRYR